MSLSKQVPAEVFVDSYPTRVWYRGMAPFCQICKAMGHKAADCEYNGKSCVPVPPGLARLGRWSSSGQRCPLVDAESFPPIVAPPVAAEVEVTPGSSGVPETTEPVNSMDVVDVLAENSYF